MRAETTAEAPSRETRAAAAAIWIQDSRRMVGPRRGLLPGVDRQLAPAEDQDADGVEDRDEDGDEQDALGDRGPVDEDAVHEVLGRAQPRVELEDPDDRLGDGADDEAPQLEVPLAPLAAEIVQRAGEEGGA